MSPSKGEASNSSAVRPRAESAALKASSVGAKADTLAEVSSKAFSKPAALMAAAKVVWSGLLLAASMSPVVTSGLMQSGLPWLKLEAPSVSVALAAAGITSALALAAGISSAVALAAGIAGITSAVALPTAGIDKAGISSAVAFGAASSCRRLLLPPPLRASMADWGSITASMTCTMPWQVYTSLSTMVALPLPATSISAVYGSPTMWYLRMSPSKGEASKSSAVRPRAESAALKASSVGAKTVTLAEVSSKAFSKPAALMAATRVERSGVPAAASMSPVVTSGLMQSGLPWLKLEAPSASVALAAAG